MEGGEVKQGEAVEEADALQGHLDDPGGVRLLGALRTLRVLGRRLWRGAVQQDTVEGVNHSHQVCGPQLGRQPSRVLALIVEYTWRAVGERER